MHGAHVTYCRATICHIPKTILYPYNPHGLKIQIDNRKREGREAGSCARRAHSGGYRAVYAEMATLQVQSLSLTGMRNDDVVE